MQIIPVSLNGYNFYLPLLAIILLAVAIVIALDCAWRVEKKLRVFMKLLIAAIFVLLSKKLLEITGFNQAEIFRNFFQYLDILFAFFLLCAVGEMYRIIRDLDGEGRSGKK